jgi:putative membrane-bound dehydrogenase-like protein
MRGYPYPEKTPSGRITRLEDRDGDGRFDACTIFLAGLAWPTSVVPYDGGVFIAVAPDILYAKDTDGDGVADLKKVMFAGFGNENVQGLLNGLLWGPDGWIYGVTSSNGGEIGNLTRPEQKPVSVRGRDFRFKPDGSLFEAVSGGGQFGHSFDDWGHRFTCSNSNHIRQIVLPEWDLERNPALVVTGVTADIAAEGAAAPVYRISQAEPWRLVRTRQRAADPDMRKRLPPTELVATGFFTSATGVTIYRGSAYPEEYRGNAFVGDVGGNLVHRKSLTPLGATYRAARADQGVEFLASTDNWFRPVNFTNTPDGTLLILDMYRETIEHPWSIPEPIKQHLDLTSGKDRGRLFELVRDEPGRHRRPRLSGASTSELVGFLADPDAWWRETAQRLLIERRDPAAIQPLRDLVARRPSALGRLHGLWTLQVLGALEPRDVLLGLNDPEPRLREQAVRLSGTVMAADPGVRSAVVALAGDPDSMVRFQVALSLGEAGPEPAVINALAQIAVRDAADPWTRMAIQSSVAHRAGQLLAVLAEKPRFLGSSQGQLWLGDLATLIGGERDPAQIKQLLKRLQDTRTGSDVMTRVLIALNQGLRRAGSSLTAVLGEEAAALLEPLGKLAEETAMSAMAADRRLPAIALLALAHPGRIVALMPDLLDAHEPTDVQLAALHALGEVHDPGVARSILARWKSMSPSVRREAAEMLFSRPERLEPLIEALEAKALPVSEIEPDRIKQLRVLKEPRLRARACRILDAAGSPGADRKAAIESYRTALGLAGEPGRGRAVFQKACATCHRLAGQGIDVGPDLATVSGRSEEDLLLHILDPNREVASNYINYNVATVDGRTLSGIIAAESAAAITLKRAEGVIETVPRSQVEAIASTGSSLMPEGLEKGLDPRDFADLIALLRSIPAAASNTAVSQAVSALRLHPDNPHYFLYNNKPTVLITSGEHYGAVLNLDFDFKPYLDEIERCGFNLTRTFSGTYREIPGSFKIRDNTLAPKPGRNCCPWAQHDGKFDLDHFSVDYFRRLKEFLTEASRRGIVVEYVLFCPLYDDSLWDVNPMNAKNNVNGIGAIPREQVYTLGHADLLERQLTFVRKAVTELNEFDNLYFEICNEPYFGGVTLDWQRRVADTIVATEQGLPRRHLIAQNIANGSARVKDPHLAVSIFNFHYASPPDAVAENRHLARPVGFDETGFKGTGDHVYRQQAWEFLLAGGAVFSNLDYSFTTDHEDGLAKVEDPTPGGGGPALRSQLSILQAILDKFDLIHSEPVEARAIVQQAGARPIRILGLADRNKRVYWFYVPSGPSVRLSLKLPKGNYSAGWIDPRNGGRLEDQTLRSEGEDATGAVIIESPRFAEDAAVRIATKSP